MRTERVIAQLRSSIERNVRTGKSDTTAQQILALMILSKERIDELEKENSKLRRELRRSHDTNRT